ncbi:hypothetical protein DPMN_135846 [Dreissena polymorpha]|uniref:Uncharacterized protein n=1 Tax=Dreissena polymorpha TaxID=45954 RepID=A0A9D4JH85_DREPO|nr:hypothetical protein DPMN_135846 [Dreissena polymorpha]
MLASYSEFLRDQRSAEEKTFRTELLKSVRVDRTPDRVRILIPMTLKAFMEMEEDGKGVMDCRCFQCEIAFSVLKELILCVGSYLLAIVHIVVLCRKLTVTSVIEP